MPVPSLGPLLVAMSVNTTLLPTGGVALSTVLTTERSVVAVGTGVTVEVLFAAAGSLSVPVMVAVLAYGPVAFTVAVMVSVEVMVLARAPILHMPVAGS
ncbi:hypothetical protein D3C85_1213690 [compost metagenome]